MLDTHRGETLGPPLELSSVGHVEPDVVEPGATLVELLTLIARVLVQADEKPALGVDHEYGVAGLFPLVVRECPWKPLEAKHLLVPVHTGLNIANGGRKVMNPGDCGLAIRHDYILVRLVR